MINYKKYLSWGIVAVLVVVAVVWLLRLEFSPGHKPTPTPINKIEHYPVNQVPRAFPTQLPIEAGAKIFSNYNATSPGGQLQATRVFLSTKSVQANFDLYKSYLTKNGWKIMGEINDPAKPDQRALFAKNASGLLTISIYKATTGSTVDLSFLPVK